MISDLWREGTLLDKIMIITSFILFILAHIISIWVLFDSSWYINSNCYVLVITLGVLLLLSCIVVDLMILLTELLFRD